MNKSEKIRELGRSGLPVAEIARSLGIRYQHVRKVLISAGLLSKGASVKTVRATELPTKPSLRSDVLLQAGFSRVGLWTIDDSAQVNAPKEVPIQAGVYAFCIDGIVQYVGVATMGLSKRLRFYCRPGKTQMTSLRINGILRDLLPKGTEIELLTAIPNDTLWNGLPVNSAAGLEVGLIQQFSLPWNKRGTAQFNGSVIDVKL